MRRLAAYDHRVGQMLDAALNFAGRDERLAHLDLLQEISGGGERMMEQNINIMDYLSCIVGIT